MLWMVKPEFARRYARAMRDGVQPTNAQLDRFTAARSRGSGQEGPPCLTIAGDVAQIAVDGVLTPQPDWICWYLFGNTAYSEIREALAAAETNPAVKRVQWMFSSPGGMVDGFFDLLPAIETAKKPSDVLASLACSAAYGLAAVAGKITATSPASEFGSVGCVRTYFVDGPAAEELSIDVTSTEAPNKRPDVTTPEGLAVVKRELDVQHDLLVDAIARGRSKATGSKVSKALVNSEFGRGGSVYAEEAADKGMIDKAPPRKPRAGASSAVAENEERDAPRGVTVAVPEQIQRPEPSPAPTTATAPVVRGAKAKVQAKMNKKEFQEQHPEVYASIVAEGRAEGVTLGVQQERDRVTAHLELAEGSGDMATAVDAIKNGAAMTATVQAKHMKASMRRQDQAVRQGETDAAGRVADNAAAPKSNEVPADPKPGTSAASSSEEGDLGDRVVARLEALHGKKPAAK